MHDHQIPEKVSTLFYRLTFAISDRFATVEKIAETAKAPGSATCASVHYTILLGPLNSLGGHIPTPQSYFSEKSEYRIMCLSNKSS